jgi:hypothetical protein
MESTKPCRNLAVWSIDVRSDRDSMNQSDEMRKHPYCDSNPSCAVVTRQNIYIRDNKIAGRRACENKGQAPRPCTTPVGSLMAITRIF